MTLDVPSTAIVAGLGVVGWFLLRLTVFEAIRELRESSIRQGKRIGNLEAWRRAAVTLEQYKQTRRNTAATGVPEDEDSDPGER